jgi:3-hydroxyisobutyrate dehydrogenase
MKVGFIGLGTMGAGMAANLQKAGHELVVHDIRRAAAERHLAAGAVWADTPKALAEQCEVIFTSLPGPPEVEAVALGEGGLIAGMKDGTAYFDLSTNSPTLGRELNRRFAEKHLYMLDAPVSGGPRGAASGRLALWVGGDEQIFNRHKPVLDAIGDQARYIGPIGAGSVAKLVHNCAGYAIQCMLAEVFTMGVKAGVEPLALWEAVRQGAGGRRRTFDALGDHFLPDKYDPPDFALRLAHKDVTLATQLGREMKVPMHMANLALDELTAALNRGWENRDSRVAMLLQQERAGIKIAVPEADVKAAIERDGKG